MKLLQIKDAVNKLAEVNFFYVAEFLNTKLLFFSQTAQVLAHIKLWST